MQEKQVSMQLIICGHDPEQTSWRQWQMFSNVVKPYFMRKFDSSLLKDSGLEMPRKVD